MSKLRISFALLAGLLSILSPLSAHHGSSVSYKMDKPIVLKGTVTLFVWSNPHCAIYFDTKDAHGRVVQWGSETDAPRALTRVGWAKDSLKPGDRITITVFPSTFGQHFGLLSKIVLGSGQELVPAFQESR